MILPDSTEWREYLEQAMFAQLMALPVPDIRNQKDEPHPVTDSLEEEE